MHTTLSRSAHVDQLEAELRDARCCDELRRCVDCRAKITEIRAARRDTLIHTLAIVRPRRLGR